MADTNTTEGRGGALADGAEADRQAPATVELFALRGSRPSSLAASISRATDLAFGGQTRRILEGREREHRLRAFVGRLAAWLPSELRDDPEVLSILAEAEAGARSATLLCLGYPAAPDDAYPGGPVDFSPATSADRWETGARGMHDALRRFGAAPLAEGLAVHEVDA